jgi:ubiquinone/menaquinone biosynthesis C-methylase UbiE
MNSNLYGSKAEIYDLIYANKGYGTEADALIKLIFNHFGSDNPLSLLDVACGTGRHLAQLVNLFSSLTGTDISEDMLAIAAKRLGTSVKLIPADMVTMKLGKQYNVVTCMFSAIGYAKDLSGLRKTLSNFEQHLAPGGMLIINPWLTPEGTKDGWASKIDYETDDMIVTRHSITRVVERVSCLDMSYMVTRKGQPTEFFQDTHVLGLFTQQETLETLHELGLKAEYMPHAIPRGLYVAYKS